MEQVEFTEEEFGALVDVFKDLIKWRNENNANLLSKEPEDKPERSENE